MDGEAAGVSQDPGGSLCLVAGVADVGPLDAVDHEGVAADPDLGFRVVLGIRGEDPAGADDDVVDV
jgi:hypothetical protein